MRVFDIADDMYATTGEAARILGVAPTTLRRWARQGHIRHLTDPNGWRLYRAGDIHELRNERAARAAAGG